MKKAQELRANIDELEKNVKELVDKFIDENGVCDINIDTNMRFIETGNGQKTFVSSNLKIYVSI